MNDNPGWRPGGGSASGTRFFENLAYLVPGYHGYKEKDLRQEEDSRLRSRVLAKLQLIMGLLEGRRERMKGHASEAELEQLNVRLRRIEALAEAVRYAPYGFSGFFEAETVREETLERLLETDLLLFQDLDDTVDAIRRSSPSPADPQNGIVLLALLDAQIAEFEMRLVMRDKILADH